MAANVNLAFVKSQVRRLISTAPLPIVNYRQNWVDDGYGGLIKDGEPFTPNEKPVTALFDNASSPTINVLVSDGGKRETESPLRLFIEWEEGIDLKKDDWWTHLGTKYRFSNVTNILELDILYEVDLEVVELNYVGT